MEFLLILNLTSTFMLCGLIWTIQLVHYPSFHLLDRENFNSHMAFHKFRISIIVVPLMLTELITSTFLAFFAVSLTLIHQIGFLLVLTIWLTTFLFQVPLHSKISEKYNEESVTKLVRTNIVRTVLWSFKAMLGFYILWILL